ncbi:MAG: histidine phosphatase family protein [Ruminococcaceae bacterium]|nr:histidine phosphatase family protein [Oscillospiraceae bacterium]
MIWLMRHGEDDNTRLGGWSDASLSPLGREQARRAGETLLRSTCPVRHIFSSDLPRAKETAEIVAERLKLGVTPLEEFREVNNGDLAGISKERFQAEYPGLYWSSLAWERAYPNGESPRQFFDRIQQAWKDFKNRAERLDGDVLLVTHQGVIDVILCAEEGVPYTNKHPSHGIAHAEIVAI